MPSLPGTERVQECVGFFICICLWAGECVPAVEMYRGQKTICRSQTQVVKLGYKNLYMLMHLADPRRLSVHVCVSEHARVFTGALGCVHICGLCLSGVS